MNKQWRDKLNALLDKNNSSERAIGEHNETGDEDGKSFTDVAKPTHKTHKTGCEAGEGGENPLTKLTKLDGEVSPTSENPLTELTKLQSITKLSSSEEPETEAERMGLVAAWSGEFGFVSLHDPTTGEWHDVKTSDAPDWAVPEAFKRKELYRSGNRRAYRLTSREMEELWEAEHSMPDEGIVEDHPIPD